MIDVERNLLTKAITALTCALAHDEASQSGQCSEEELSELRSHWVDDAESAVDEAMQLGLWEDDDA